MSNAAASLSTYINQAEAADDAAAGDTVNAFGRWTPKEQAAHKRAAEATARAKAAAASPPPPLSPGATERERTKAQTERHQQNLEREQLNRFSVRPGSQRGREGGGGGGSGGGGGGGGGAASPMPEAPPPGVEEYNDLLLVYNLWDPTGELPEDRIGLAVSLHGLTLIDPETREQELFLNWARIEEWTGIASAAGTDDMEIVVLRTSDRDEFQFECDDAKLVVDSITAMCKTAAAAAGGAASARQHRASTNLSVSGQDESLYTEKQKAHDLRKKHNRNLFLSIMQIAVFLFVGWLVLAVFFQEQKTQLDDDLKPMVDENGSPKRISWSVIDCIYFGFVTITTVGYGDLTPTTEGAKVFVIFYAAFGVIALGICMRRIAKIVLEKQEMIQRKVASAMVAGGSIRRDLKGKTVFTRKTTQNRAAQRANAAERSRKTKKLRSALGLNRNDFRKYGELTVALVPMLVIMCAGFVIGVIEGWGTSDSIYWVVITMLSVGYGDLSPKSQAGRLFALIFIPVGVVALMNMISSLYEINTKYSKRRLTSLKALLQMDRDGNGEVNLAEFQLFMLKHMGKFNDADLRMTREQFVQLDKTGDGLLNADDIDVEAVPGKNVKVLV
jgi:potassium channel subfamily K